MRFILILFLLVSSDALAQWKLVEPEKVSIDAFKYQNITDSYIAPDDKELKYGGIFTTDLNIIRFNNYRLFWNNDLFFDQSGEDGRVKHAGWHYKFGATLYSNNKGTSIELFREHESRHVFDETRELPFPQYNRYGISIILLESKRYEQTKTRH